MDLSNLASAIGFAEQVDTYFLTIKAPDGQPIKRLDGVPFQIELESADMSETTTAFLREMFDAEKAAKASGVADDDGPEEDREKNMRFLSRLTRGWNFQNLATGEDVPFSQENAYLAYMGRKNDWLRKQVNAGVRDQSKFFQKRSIALVK